MTESRGGGHIVYTGPVPTSEVGDCPRDRKGNKLAELRTVQTFGCGLLTFLRHTDDTGRGAPCPASDKTVPVEAVVAWPILVVSGVLEAVWAIALNKSEGFSRIVPSGVFVVALVLSMIGLACLVFALLWTAAVLVCYALVG